jgi:hypothetical protein
MAIASPHALTTFPAKGDKRRGARDRPGLTFAAPHRPAVLIAPRAWLGSRESEHFKARVAVEQMAEELTVAGESLDAVGRVAELRECYQHRAAELLRYASGRPFPGTPDAEEMAFSDLYRELLLEMSGGGLVLGS